MTPDEYITQLRQRLQNAAEQAVTDAAPDIERTVATRLPSGRQKTRRAVRAIPRETTLHLQLDFDRDYRQRGTKTERLMRSAVERSRPQITEHLTTHLFNAIK